eukprot:gb/GFBE01029155.1/.p1 GENE.gb/GFBE01029155.1/~~gb/GFBE01029155.1/.p1  ORF type:complete len:163 (+),score=37.78 gb/GFBE01029155.1/:1-489(+)
MNRPDGSFTGTAFVVYSSEKEVARALKWNGDYYKQRQIVVRPAGKGSKGEGKGKVSKETKSIEASESKQEWNSDHDRTVSIFPLPDNTTERHMKRDFRDCGEIESIRLLKDRSGQFKGAAFIVFKTVAGAEKAFDWNGKQYGKRTIKVTKVQSKQRHEKWSR